MEQNGRGLQKSRDGVGENRGEVVWGGVGRKEGREWNQSLIRRKVLSAVICPSLGDQDSGRARQPESHRTLWGLVGLVEWCDRFFAESPEQAPE